MEKEFNELTFEELAEKYFSKDDTKLERIIQSIDIESKKSPYYKDKYKYELEYQELKNKEIF
jgi:hypothetical protein